MSFHWLGRRWFDFQTGYSQYLNFTFNFSNFILILWGLAPMIKETFYFPIFVGIIIATVLPLATIIGNAHYRKQFPVTQEVQLTKNPFMYKILPNSKETVQYQTNIILLKAIRDLQKEPTAWVSIDKALELNKKLLEGHDSRDFK